MTQYVRSRRKEAKAKKNRNVELILMVMQRRLASSPHAITCTLRNRLAALDEVLRILRDPSRSAVEKKRLPKGDTGDIPGSYPDYEDLDEAQRDAVERKVFRQVLSDNPEEVEKERAEVGELLRRADALNKAGHKEAKFTELRNLLDTSDVIRRENEKLVIFTEHKDTMTNLTERLTHLGYTVTTIHGGMDLMGRVFNLVASDTREGAVLERILSKLDIMREQLGDDRVYDVVDELLEQVPLLSLIEHWRAISAGGAAACAR